MKINNIAFLTIRVLSVYLLIKSFSASSKIIGMIYLSSSTQNKTTLIMQSALFLLGGQLVFLLSSIYLWIKSKVLTKYFIMERNSCGS